MTTTEVPAIGQSPQAMQRKIREELCAKHLRHPLVRWWSEVDKVGARAICHHTVDFFGLAQDEHLFFPRTHANETYILTSGFATYVRDTLGHKRVDGEVQRSDFVARQLYGAS